MRVAVFHNLPSGGAKRALYGFVRCLTRAGHTVDAYLPDTANEAYLPLAPVAHKCVVFPVKRTLKGLIASAVRYLPTVRPSLADLETTHQAIATAINRDRPDIVLVEQDQYVFSPFLLKFLDRAAVYYCQQPFRGTQAIFQNLARPSRASVFRTLWSEQVWARRLPTIDRQNASAARYILANSYFSRECILSAYGLNSFVCYLGVDTEVFRPAGSAREDFVLSVGALTVSKGYDFLVRAIGRIGKAMRPRFLIVANAVEAPWKGHIEHLARETDVDLTVRTGVSDAELARYYNTAKVFAYAPYLEPFGLAPLEAMACGTPVVAVNEGGLRESIVDQETGLLTDRDESRFAAAVVDLLSDRERRLQLADRGMAAIRRFWTLEQAGERLVGHLERARAVRQT